jgi:peptidoglycan hydrolase CwlO-like protein
MLNLDQVRLLENRVMKAVGKIESLTAENGRLKNQLTSLQSRVNELEGLVRSFKDDQGRIEEGILNALDRLSAFEDSAYSSQEAAQEHTIVKTAQAAPTSVEQGSPSLEQSSTSRKDHDSPAIHAEPAASAAEAALPIEIEADWNSSGEETHSAVSPENGQMDIF